MASRENPEDRVARAMVEVAAYHDRRKRGDDEPVAEFLENLGDLAELAEPMLDLSMTLTTPGAADSAPPELERFGQFRLLSRLGQGGMGTVHLAIDESLGRRVALKQIRPENLGSEQARARFEREARAVSRVDHPNLCQVFYTGEESGTPYLVMQFVEGETLRDKIQRARTGEAPLLSTGSAESSGSDSSTPSTRGEFHAIVALVEKVARALHHAHEQGLVHRDVKPGNVMVREDGTPVLLDFGLVREEDTDLSLTSSAQQLGTPLYMAPEQIVARGDVDRRTDVYALGATLYECLTLQAPFSADTRQELFQRILRDEPRGASRVNRSVPKDLDVIAAKAMEKDPRRRYATALELAEDLRRVRELQPIRARRAGPVYRLQRWTRRNPFAALLIASITAGLAISLLLLGERNDALADSQRLLGERDEAVGMARANLDNFLRLGIRTRLDALESRAEPLFPAWPENEALLHEWVADARQLDGEAQEIRDVLEELREGARPPTEEEIASDRANHPALELRAKVTDERDRLAAALAEVPEGAPERVVEDLETDIAACERRLGILEQRLEEPWRVRFEDDGDQFLHDALTSVLVDLDAFFQTEPGRIGLLPRMEARAEWASTIRARSIEDASDDWDRAIAAIAASDLYGGLEITPQIGLVPIGEDPESGLWEFHHLASGAAPERDEDERIVVTFDTGIVFVLLPGGTFHMGSQKSDPNAPNHDAIFEDANEMPVHEVTLDPFFIAKHETSQAQWMRMTDRDRPSRFWAGSSPVGELITFTHPVEYISWHTCDELMRLHGLVLPTEAQWEYACRAGTETAWWTGPDRASLEGTVNIADGPAAPYFPVAQDWLELDDGYITHAPVDEYWPNPFGLHGIHSNVSEWCRDPFGHYTTDVRAGDGYRLEDNATDKMVRGGSFRDPVTFARSATRVKYAPVVEDEYTGVRAARELLD